LLLHGQRGPVFQARTGKEVEGRARISIEEQESEVTVAMVVDCKSLDARDNAGVLVSLVQNETL